MKLRSLALLPLLCPAAWGQVTYERILHADSEPANWLTYSGNYAGHRFSPLRQITRENVAGLKPAWVYQMEVEGRVETSPLVVDGIMYITEKPFIVTALDGRTGRPLWTYRRPEVREVPSCCGQVNRGLAILGDTLFFGTLDAHLVALDARTGAVRWDIVVADWHTGHSITAAPLIVKDKVIVGISGGDYGIRGFLDAYDPATGHRVWRLWTVPQPGEPGSETWGKNDNWKSGGAPTWVTGSYDPELNLLYWGTGNPGGDYGGEERPGDDLYSDCLLAIDPDTGTIRWHFQFTPHDLHDWDSNQVPVLIDDDIAGKPRKLVLQANRNAFYYVLDRVTGEFIAGRAFTKQTWAKRLDAKGRPELLGDPSPTVEGKLTYPGLFGGTSWYSPSYSPAAHLFYVMASDDFAQVFYKLPQKYEAGVKFERGGTRDVAGAEPFGAVRALDPTTGALRWEFKLDAVAWCGLLSTEGGLVFGGTREGAVFALDAETGRNLWHFQAGGQVSCNPISFEVEGKQYVSVAAGNAIMVFGL
jgi:alcohol dehydrogenase (cytochrome c)